MNSPIHKCVSGDKIAKESENPFNKHGPKPPSGKTIMSSNVNVMTIYVTDDMNVI